MRWAHIQEWYPEEMEILRERKQGLEASLARAQETLPDRRRFFLNLEEWTAFQAVLNASPMPAPRLAKLLREPSVFEQGAIE